MGTVDTIDWPRGSPYGSSRWRIASQTTNIDRSTGSILVRWSMAHSREPVPIGRNHPSVAQTAVMQILFLSRVTWPGRR